MNSTDGQLLYKKIGMLIKEHRIKKKPHVSQEQLSKLIEMSRTSIVNIEMGRHNVQIHTLYKIAKALQINIQDLIPDIHLETEKKVQYSPSVSEASKKKLEKRIPNFD
jgi:DNA-binding XRE family transcriptional regulator